MSKLILENLYEKKLFKILLFEVCWRVTYDGTSLETFGNEALKIIDEYAKSIMSDKSYEPYRYL